MCSEIALRIQLTGLITIDPDNDRKMSFIALVHMKRLCQDLSISVFKQIIMNYENSLKADEISLDGINILSMPSAADVRLFIDKIQKIVQKSFIELRKHIHYDEQFPLDFSSTKMHSSATLQS